MPNRSFALMAILLASLSLAPFAFAQEPPRVGRYDFTPGVVQHGDTVSAKITTSVSYGVLATSATLDLSPIGLSATTPTTAYFDQFSATFTVPPGTPAGDYDIKATIMASTVLFASPVATLHVTNAPLLRSAAFDPSSIKPGQSSTFTAIVSQGDAAITSISADLSAFGLSAATPMAKTSASTYACGLTVPETALEKFGTATVTMTDALNRSSVVTAGLTVYRLHSPVLESLTFTPPYVRPGGAVTGRAGFHIVNCRTESVTADLSAFGLSPVYTVPGDSEDRAVTFTVPSGQAEGAYDVVLTVSDNCGMSYTTRGSFSVTRGPIITYAAYEDDRVMPDEYATITAAVDPGEATSINVTADLTTFGLSATEPLTNYGSPSKYYRTFVAHDPNKVYDATVVTATDSQGRSSSASAYLAVATGGRPHQIAVTASPETVRPGEVETITIAPNGFPTFSAYADLSAFGFPYYQNFGTFPLRPLTFTVPANTPPGPYRVVAWTSDEGSDIQSDSLILTVTQPVLHGDVNGDGTFTVPDVLAALRIAGGLAKSTDLALLAASTPGAPLSRLSVADAVRLAHELRAGSVP